MAHFLYYCNLTAMFLIFASEAFFVLFYMCLYMCLSGNRQPFQGRLPPALGWPLKIILRKTFALTTDLVAHNQYKQIQTSM